MAVSSLHLPVLQQYRHPDGTRALTFHFYIYSLLQPMRYAAIAIPIATTTGSLALVLTRTQDTSAALWRKLRAPICANVAERLQPQKEAPVARM